MTITVDSPIVGDGGPLEVTYDVSSARRTDEIDRYVRELHRICGLIGLDWRILFAQAWHETGGFTSFWWAQRLNPAGLGITGDAAQNDASPIWTTGDSAARAHLRHMALYVFGNYGADKAALIGPPAGDFHYQEMKDAGYLGIVKTISDLTGRWGADPGYAQGIVNRFNALFKEEPSVTLYQIVGLTGPGIELPVPLSHDIIALSQPNQRPGITRQLPGYWVQHETANTAPGADAAMHNRWLHNGADGSQLSFHFCVDDGAIYQMIPIDEVTWQAADGGGPGNMSGVSCELCVNLGIDTAKARHNAEALAGGILRALGLGVDRVKRHWDFNAGDPNRHHCPDEMMNDGYWPTFVENVGAIIGAKPPTNPTIPTVPWSKTDTGVHDLHGSKALAFLGQSKAKRNVPVRVAADPKSAVIATIKAGETVTIRGSVKTDRNRFVFVDLGEKGVGRALWSAFAERWPVL